MFKIFLYCIYILFLSTNAWSDMKINAVTGKLDRVSGSSDILAVSGNVGIGTVTRFAGYVGISTLGPFQTVEVAGNVGIGSTTPGQKLDVNGTIRSTSGGYKFPDGTTQTTASVGQWLTQVTANVGIGTYDNVGIGTVTPTTKLTVYETASDTGVDINSVGPSDFDAFQQLLLHNDDVALSDSSTNAFTVTKVNGVTRSAAQSKFGGFSALFTSATSDYVSIPDSDIWAYGNGQWTIDFWVNLVSDTAGGVYDQWVDTNNRMRFYISNGDQRMLVRSGGVNLSSLNGISTINNGTWYHIAYVHSDTGASGMKIYVDGVQSASGSGNFSVPNYASTLDIGRDRDSGPYFNGYIDEFRISNTARWTTAFTPYTVAYSNVGVNKPRLKFMSAGNTKFTLGVDGADNNQLKIGTTAISTNTRMAIDSDGNVGIGTVNPGQVLDVAGVIRSAAGSVTAPSLTTTADNDTGVFYPAANVMALTTGGVESMRINGNIGIGTTTAQGKFIAMGGNIGLGTWAPRTNIEMSGNVGIGTVNQATTGQFVVRNAQNNTSIMRLYRNTGLPVFTVSDIGALGGGTSATTYSISDVGNASLGGLSITGAQTNTAGNVGISTTTAQAKLLITTTTATGTANMELMGLFTHPTWTEAASGNHPLIASVGIGTGSVTVGVATVGDVAGLAIEGPPSAVQTGLPYSIWSGSANSGVNRFDGNMGIGTTMTGQTARLAVIGGNVGIGTFIPQGALSVMSGNVGIGTWVPAQMLEVKGNVGIGTTTVASTPYAININNVAVFNSEFNITTNVGVGTTTVNWNNGVYQNVGIGTNGTNSYIAFTHPTNGGVAKLQLRILQDGTGGRDLPLSGAWPSTVKWSGGTQPTLTTTAGKSDIINCTWNGTTDYCGTMLNF